MSLLGEVPTLEWVENYTTAPLCDAGARWRATAKTWDGFFTQLARDVQRPGGTEWTGVGADAAQGAADKAQFVVRGASNQLNAAADTATFGKDQLDGLRLKTLSSIQSARDDGFVVGSDLSVTDTKQYSRDDIYAAREQYMRAQQAKSHAEDIQTHAAQLLGMDREYGRKLLAQTEGLDQTKLPELGGGTDGHVQLVDDHKESGGATPDGDRKHNQEEAFKQLYGRSPVSANDWEMAAALDPHTYNPDFKGTPSEVRVVKINPVPGQGVVRVSQWIPQHDVTSFPPNKRDLGNNRGPDAHFDPENTKVSTYIDYEHGIVVMRQNPSVEMNPDGSPGQVKVGVPQGSVTQTPDGAVRIKYDAGNPFAPGAATNPQGPIGDHRATVNGDLVFTPGPGGVHVDGTRTDYPSMEIYQDMPNGSTHTVLIDPAQSGSSAGPALNLPFHHDVGIGGRAFEPFDRGGWNPRYDVSAPLPPTPFGPVTAPPSVPPPPSGGGVWA
ncbi:hypothetical protein MFM001_32080 [Mycobacterium sp. MFM001]|uniref:hypothetical protein n=1 Tax=Mycobacterium sp. MFM001 TaxID=2049453 RepID=UPI000DA45B4C|nr:hypothetical protein [Mycobacterium sp. MFM001]GBE66746.1 hypothetical protein MFM001_32080 [Mycobacterium sp. MFM001]